MKKVEEKNAKDQMQNTRKKEQSLQTSLKAAEKCNREVRQEIK